MSNPNLTVFVERGGAYVSLVIEIDRYGRFPTAEVSGFSAMEEVFFAEGWRLESEPDDENEDEADVETFPDLESTVVTSRRPRRRRNPRQETVPVAQA